MSPQGGSGIGTPHTAPPAPRQPSGLADGGATAAGDRRIVLLQDSLPRRGSGPRSLPGQPPLQAASTPQQLPHSAGHGRWEAGVWDDNQQEKELLQPTMLFMSLHCKSLGLRNWLARLCSHSYDHACIVRCGAVLQGPPGAAAFSMA
jgi:hypothetical protein